MCAGAGKWALAIARQRSAEREQWGKPIGRHEVIGTKLAFIAATTFVLEAVFELSAELVAGKARDIRIEAAAAKLWSSEMACLIADELVQLRGGRGYETAESLATKGERAVGAEQLLRDLRINRIFEGSSEIMRLLIAREAVDARLRAAGALASADATFGAKAKAAASASGFYARWLPPLVVGAGSLPTSYGEFEARAPPVLPRPYRRHRLGVVRDVGRLHEGGDAARDRSGEGGRRVPARGCVLREVPPAHPLLVRCPVAQHRRGRRAAGRIGAREGVSLARAGVLDASEGTGPWVAVQAPGPSSKENQRRHYR
jgi:hypothetical protein